MHTRERKVPENTCTESTCAVHNRVDRSVFDEENQVVFIITYVGVHAVVTRVNPILESPLEALAAALAGHDTPLLVTAVQYVGDGTVGGDEADDEPVDIRWITFYEEDSLAQATHNRVVERVNSGDIDLTVSQDLNKVLFEGISSK
jgi:hypothetical protein